MQKKITLFAFILVMAYTVQLKAQYDNQESTYKKFFQRT